MFLVTNLVINYILFDLKRAKEFGANVADGAAILAFLEEAQDLRRCENMAEIPRLISTVQATLIHVPSYHHKKIIVSGNKTTNNERESERIFVLGVGSDFTVFGPEICDTKTTSFV